MKKSLKKIWGIGLVLVLLASMLTFASPAAAANEGWSPIVTPTGTFYQLAATDVANLTVAPNGDLFSIDNSGGAGTHRVYKSTDGGYTWTRSAPIGTGTLVDLAVSPSYATDSAILVLEQVAAAPGGSSQVWVSANGGTTFGKLGNAIAEAGTSLDVAPNYTLNNGEVMVGTADAPGNVYTWFRNNTQAWEATVSTAGTASQGIMLYFPTALGTNGATDGALVVTYIDQDGNGPEAAAAVAIPAAGVAAGTTINVPLNGTDTGVRSVTLVTDAAVGTKPGSGQTVYVIGKQTGTKYSSFTYNAGTIGAPEYAIVHSDVIDVAYSPSYPVDGTRLAVFYNASSATWASTLVGADLQWNSTIPTMTKISAEVAPVSTSIAFPSDFNASLPTLGTYFVGLNGTTAGNDGVYRAVINGAAAASLGLAVAPQTIAYDGNSVTGTLFAGASATTAVWKSSNATAVAIATVAWAPNFGAPTGVGTTYVALANDFATSNIVYAGTAGANSALNVSEDGGVYFHQTGQINTTIAAATGINDFQPASETEFFLLTNDGATNCSLWRTVDGGAKWYRTFSVVAGASTAIIRLSPDYANDKSIFYGDLGVAGANSIMMSNNNGKSWTGRSAPIAIGDIAVKDQYTIYVGGSAANTIQMTSNGGWTWQAVATAANTGTAINDIEVDLSTGAILVGTNAGTVEISTNNNVTYKGLGAPTGATLNMVVDFDADYANNNLVYAGSATGAGTGIYRTDASAIPNTWSAINTTITAGDCEDIVVAASGQLYAANNAAAGGAARLLEPSMNLLDAARPTSQNLAMTSVGAPLAATDLFSKVRVVPGENQNTIYAVNAAVAGNSIMTYTDTLINNIPVKTAPSADAIINAGNVLVAVEATAGPFATYQIQWNDRADWAGTGAFENFTPFPNFNRILGATAAVAPPAGSTIYYRVRVTAPAFGPWSEVYTVTTELVAPAAPNAPAMIGAVGEGSTRAGGWGVSLNPTFYWGPITGATTYEFQLAKDTAFTDLVVDATGGNALGDVQAYQYTAGALDFDTSYFWRVRAIGASSQTSWSQVQGFTTMEEPQETVAPPTGGTETTVTFTQPPATTVTFEIPDDGEDADSLSSGMLWAIIVIGAVLVIALIVLIVRTRRSV